MKLRQGKIPYELLRKVIERIKVVDRSVLVGPREGFDSAVIDFGSRYMVVSNDPSFYIPESIPDEFFAFGAVNWPASDVAVFGAHPRWLVYSLLLPIGIDDRRVERLANLIVEESEKLGIDVIGGHTGVYKSLNSPVASSTVMGFVDKNRLVLPSNAKVGDYIVLTKELGLEFAIAISFENPDYIVDKFGNVFLKELQSRYRELSVIQEALALAENRIPNAMHDVTEGGFTQALIEIANNSGVGFKVFEDDLNPSERILEVLNDFNVNPLNVSSSGCLIASVDGSKLDQLDSTLGKLGVEYKVVGTFTEGGFKIVKSDGREEKIRQVQGDAFAEFFA